MFSVKLDKSKADSVAVKQYIDEYEKQFDKAPLPKEETKVTDQIDQNTVYQDKESELKITLPFYNQFDIYHENEKKDISYYGFY